MIFLRYDFRMFDSFLAQILAIFLLFISGARIFFLKEPKIDSAAVVSPFALAVCAISYFIWGFSAQLLAVSALSVLFFLTNVRSIFRVASGLLVDHYSVVFIISTVVELLLLILVAVFVVYFRPVRYAPGDFSVKKETFGLNGTFANGFRISDDYRDVFRKRSAGTLSVYSPVEKIEWISTEESIFNLPKDAVVEQDAVARPVEATEIAEENPTEVSTNPTSEFPEESLAEVSADSVSESEEKSGVSAKSAPIILFVGTSAAPVSSYEPYLILLAQRGFTVLAADFYPIDGGVFGDFRNSLKIRRFALMDLFLRNEELYSALRPILASHVLKGYEALSRLALVNFREKDGSQRKIFYVTDSLSSDEVFSFSDKFSDSVSGSFQLDTIPEFKTPGFGFPEQTDLILARHFGMKRDGEFFIPRYLSTKTVQKVVSGS